MKLGFSTLACPKWTWDDILSNARRFGYDGLELRFICDERNLLQSPEMQPDRLATTHRQLADAGLAIACVDTSCSLITADAAVLALAQRHIDLAVELNAPFVRVFGGRVPKDADPKRLLETAARNFRALAEYGKPRGVRPLIETHDDFIASPRVLELLRATAHENIGVVWDVHHPFRFVGESVRETYAQLRPHVYHVHVKDSVMADDKCLYKLLGHGDVPVRESIALLKAGGYNDWVCIEWEKTWQPEIEEPEIALPQYAAKLKKEM